MKTLSLIGLLAISLGSLACVGAPGESDIDGVPGESDIDGEPGDPAEDTGEAQDALTVTVNMGNLGWAHATPYSTDFVLAHRVNTVYNKWAAVNSSADFPSLEGVPATQANIELCEASYLAVHVYKRLSGQTTWTSIDYQQRFAHATVSGGVITSCDVSFATDYCEPYLFDGFDAAMEVDLLTVSPAGAAGRKFNVVRYENINLVNCD
jgi:hypothetical protein